MDCLFCGHIYTEFHEIGNENRGFCNVGCQHNYYHHHRRIEGGFLYDSPCEVFGCEDWADADCFREDSSVAMCARHCQMKKAKIGIFWNERKNRWEEGAAMIVPKKREKEEEGEVVVERMTRPQTALQRLRILLEQSRENCPLLFASVLQPNDIHNSLERTGVAVIDVGNQDTRVIQTQVGALVADTFPNLSPATRADLRGGDFESANNEWTNRKVAETGMALRSYRMPAPIPLVASRQRIFTDSVVKSVHLRNPILAKATLCVWERLSITNPALHPSRWFDAPQRMLCSEDGMKFANRVKYGPTRIHYDGQPDRVQIMFTTDSGPVRLFAVPGSGTQEAQQLISEILGIQMLGGFSTHSEAFGRHPEVQALLHEFGVAVPRNGLLLWKTRVWHYEAETAPIVMGVPARVKQPFDWKSAEIATRKSNVFRIYCGVVAVNNDKRDQLIRLAFFRENNWPMEPFTHSNRDLSPIFVAEKSSQAAERGTYVELEPEWTRLRAFSFTQMKAFLLDRVPVNRLLLYGLVPVDLQ